MPVVAAALEEFNRKVSAKNIGHESDLRKAVEMFAVLQQFQVTVDLNEIAEWLEGHGWDLHERSSVRLVGDTIRSLKWYRHAIATGPVFRPEETYKRWTIAAKEKRTERQAARHNPKDA